MSYQTFAMQIDDIRNEGRSGGNQAFYESLERRLELLSQSWVPNEGGLSEENFASLLVKKQLCLESLQRRLRR